MSDFEICGICLKKYHGNAETVVVPENVRVVGELAFENCTSVKTLVFPGELYEIEDNAFLGCRNLKSVTLPDHMYAISEDAFFGCISLESMVIPQGVCFLGSRTFKECNHLKTLTIPDSVSQMSCFANLEESVTICAHQGSMAETLAQHAGFRFWQLPGTLKEGFYPEVSYNETVMFYNPSKGIRRKILERGMFVRDEQFPGYESPGMERLPYFEKIFLPRHIWRRMIFSRADSGYQVDMTLFPRNRDARETLGADRMDFYAYLNDEGTYTCGFRPARNRHFMDRNLEEYWGYLRSKDAK